MHAFSIASCLWHYGSFILLAGLIWQLLSYYHVWKIPAVCSGCRALPAPAQFLHWLRRDCPPYYSMLSNARFATGAFFISCLLFFFCHLLFAKQAPGAPYAVTAFQSPSHCCRPGCRVTSPQVPFVTGASCAFRSSKPCFKNWLFRSKNCLCQYMPWPEKAIGLLRSKGCPGSKHWLKNSPLIQIHAMELQLPWILFVMTATEKLPQSHCLLVYGTLEWPWS